MVLPDKFNFSGTPEQLTILLPFAEFMYVALKDLEATGGGSTRPIPSDIKGKIYIKLYFKGIVTGTTATHSVEKTFRLMNDDPRTISSARLKTLAERTKSKFDNFTFTTGRDTYTYNCPEQGFSRIWGHFNSQSDAMRMFEQLLDIPQLSPEWKYLSKSSLVQPGDRFQEPPQKVLQGSQLIRSNRERPIAFMKFHKSTIKFPHIHQELSLVEPSGQISDVSAALQKLSQL